jgi:hypothetical protein
MVLEDRPSKLGLFLGVTTPSVAAWMLRFTVEAFRNACTIVLLGAFLVTMATSAKKHLGGLLSEGPHVA